MSNKDRYDHQLDGLLNEIDRSAVEASDAEILEDAKLAGVDIEANAKHTEAAFSGHRSGVSASASSSRQNRLIANEVKDLQDRVFQIPASPTQQRALLQQAQKAMTVGAFRDFEGMPDSDLPALIEELYALGLLPPEDEKE